MDIIRPKSLDFSGKHIVTGTTISPTWVKETYKNLEVLKEGRKKKTIFAANGIPATELDLDFLPAASESYNISPNPEDYILVSLPIVTGDVPNRNLQGFPLEELSYFDPQYGKLVYQTFDKKPTHIDHVNQNPIEAKGVHLDVAMQPVPQYDLWKIHVLTMWDRSKDAKLVKDILEKKRTGYSMGAMVNYFLCSICGKDAMDQQTSCKHEKGKIYEGRLCFHLMVGCCFFETSSVANPADHTAVSTDIYC